MTQTLDRWFLPSKPSLRPKRPISYTTPQPTTRSPTPSPPPQTPPPVIQKTPRQNTQLPQIHAYIAFYTITLREAQGKKIENLQGLKEVENEVNRMYPGEGILQIIGYLLARNKQTRTEWKSKNTEKKAQWAYQLYHLINYYIGTGYFDQRQNPIQVQLERRKQLKEDEKFKQENGVGLKSQKDHVTNKSTDKVIDIDPPPNAQSHLPHKNGTMELISIDDSPEKLASKPEHTINDDIIEIDSDIKAESANGVEVISNDSLTPVAEEIEIDISTLGLSPLEEAFWTLQWETKLSILRHLCEWLLIDSDEVKDVCDDILSASKPKENPLILNSIGTDSQKRLYWHFGHTYRIWRETVFPDDSSWEALTDSIDDVELLLDTLHREEPRQMLLRKNIKMLLEEMRIRKELAAKAEAQKIKRAERIQRMEDMARFDTFGERRSCRVKSQANYAKDLEASDVDEETDRRRSSRVKSSNGSGSANSSLTDLTLISDISSRRASLRGKEVASPDNESESDSQAESSEGEELPRTRKRAPPSRTGLRTSSRNTRSRHVSSDESSEDERVNERRRSRRASAWLSTSTQKRPSYRESDDESSASEVVKTRTLLRRSSRGSEKTHGSEAEPTDGSTSEGSGNDTSIVSEHEEVPIEIDHDDIKSSPGLR